jgi:hypothetical protein
MQGKNKTDMTMKMEFAITMHMKTISSKHKGTSELY